MSVNIELKATKQCICDGEPMRVQVGYAYLWQTPTVDTNQIMQEENVFTAYSNWCKNRAKKYNYPKSAVPMHIAEIKKWIAEYEDKGYTIEWYEM